MDSRFYVMLVLCSLKPTSQCIGENMINNEIFKPWLYCMTRMQMVSSAIGLSACSKDVFMDGRHMAMISGVLSLPF